VGCSDLNGRPVPVVPSSAFKGFRFPPEIIGLATASGGGRIADPRTCGSVVIGTAAIGIAATIIAIRQAEPQIPVHRAR
jgi:hypothetical protein